MMVLSLMPMYNLRWDRIQTHFFFPKYFTNFNIRFAQIRSTERTIQKYAFLFSIILTTNLWPMTKENESFTKRNETKKEKKKIYQKLNENFLAPKIIEFMYTQKQY